jgi:hypothetical protein
MERTSDKNTPKSTALTYAEMTTNNFNMGKSGEPGSAASAPVNIKPSQKKTAIQRALELIKRFEPDNLPQQTDIRVITPSDIEFIYDTVKQIIDDPRSYLLPGGVDTNQQNINAYILELRNLFNAAVTTDPDKDTAIRELLQKSKAQYIDENEQVKTVQLLKIIALRKILATIPENLINKYFNAQKLGGRKHKQRKSRILSKNNKRKTRKITRRKTMKT